MNIADLSDSYQVYQLQKRLDEADKDLGSLVPATGKAFQIIDYDSDERKRILAIAMMPYLDRGDSAAAAEAKARASTLYGQNLQGLATALDSAYTTKLAWEAAKVHYESCRSMLSLEKELTRL